MADNWTSSGAFNSMIDCAYIRNGGDNNGEDFRVKITTSSSIPLHTSITGTTNAYTFLSGKGTYAYTPIYIGIGSYGFGTAIGKPIYTDLSSYGTATTKPIYTYLSNIGTKNETPIYVRTSMPITEFTANIALQIYSWSNSMTTDGKQSIGNAKRAAQDAFVRAEEFVKQLMRENYIDIKNGLVVWRTSNKNKDYVIF